MRLLAASVSLFFMLQGQQAMVVGTVQDADTGEPLAGAVVSLSDLDRAAITDAQGHYVIRNVPAGLQHITVQRIGYTQRTLHALVPRAGELQLNVRLKAAPVQLAAVKVQIPPVVRGLERGDSTPYPDRGMSSAGIRNYALLSEPDAFQALSGGEVVVDPESPSGVHVRGGSTDQTAYVLDGVPVFSPYHAAGMFTAWNVDALSRVQLSSSAPSPAFPETLSGVIAGMTRTPGVQLRAMGSISSTQARAVADGPLGIGGAGYLVSVRSGYPGIMPQRESSYLRGGTSDVLAKLEVPALGGLVRVLGYESENELAAHAVVPLPDVTDPEPRNLFEWESRSFGIAWDRPLARGSIRFQAWHAGVDAAASWARADGVTDALSAARSDAGMTGVIEHSRSAVTTSAGLRVERSRTTYSVAPGDGAVPYALSARTPVVTAFVQHARTVLRGVGIELSASAASAAGDLHFAPRARLQWQLSERWTVSSSFMRTHQFVQSLRNAESVARNVFPVDLYIGAGARGSDVPVAHSEQAVIAAEYRPAAGARIGVQTYARTLSGLLLVAPVESAPFATRAFATGTGTARGLAIDAALAGSRFGATASYGWQRVRLSHEGSSFVPDHGAAHQAEAGLLYFPTATASLRLGAAGAFHRRTTAVTGAFEWESCNLLDQGCEFSGSPESDPGALGASQLPAYLRVDLGGRKHWHVQAAGRDATLALFGSITNVIGRRNLMTYTVDPLTGERAGIEMRSRAPLVVGLDWRF